MTHGGPRKSRKHERSSARKFHDVDWRDTSTASTMVDKEAEEQERRFARRFHGRVMSETGRD